MMPLGKSVLLWAGPTTGFIALYYTAVAVMIFAGISPSILGVPLGEAPVWMLLIMLGGGVSYTGWTTLALGGGSQWWLRGRERAAGDGS